jgi:gamma-butyrobetaine dioxygenase
LVWSDGTSATVPALWLRDNCPCGECRVLATSERRKVIATEPVELAPISVTTAPTDVIVDWGTHVSRYSADWYRAIRLDIQRQPDLATSWPVDFAPPTFSYADLDESRSSGTGHVIDFLSSFAAAGVAIIRGVPTYRGESERFISRWAPIRELPFGRVHDVLVDPAGYNIAHTAEALPPHNDFVSYHWPPSGQVLHMLVNDAVGGDSFVVDGWHVASQLDEDELAVLASFPVPFRQFDATIETWTKAPIVRRRPDGAMSQIRYSNQLMQPLDPDSPDIDRFYRAYHRLSELVLDCTNQVDFRLDAGDLLIVHAHRVLHGRRAYEPASGRRHLQDVYFEFEDLVNRRFRLRQPLAEVG